MISYQSENKSHGLCSLQGTSNKWIVLKIDEYTQILYLHNWERWLILSNQEKRFTNKTKLSLFHGKGVYQNTKSKKRVANTENIALGLYLPLNPAMMQKRLKGLIRLGDYTHREYFAAFQEQEELFALVLFPFRICRCTIYVHPGTWAVYGIDSH